MKKALTILGIVLFLAVSIAVSLLDGTTTLAEICDIEEGAEIVSVKFTAAGANGRRGKSTSYKSGSVYESCVALFYEEKFHFSEIGNLAITSGAMASSPTITYSFGENRHIVLLVSKNYGKTTATGEPVYGLMMSVTGDSFVNYAFVPDAALNPSEIERLARARNE